MEGVKVLGTLSECCHVYDLAQALMEVKEEVYEDTWLREGSRVLSASLFRKASGIEVLFRNGKDSIFKDKVKEDLLDLMNYCAILYRLVELGK